MGGNGHWYSLVDVPNADWFVCRDAAEDQGGFLASPAEEAEWQFLYDFLIEQSPSLHLWLGGHEASINSSWEWVSGETWAFDAWGGAHCPSGPYPNNPPTQARAARTSNQCDGYVWDDSPKDGDGSLADFGGYVVEYSADCNNDGIIDYGQILDGSLVDDDGNGVPDSCDVSSPNITLLIEFESNQLIQGFAALPDGRFALSNGDANGEVFILNLDGTVDQVASISDADVIQLAQLAADPSPMLYVGSDHELFKMDLSTYTVELCSLGTNVHSVELDPQGDLTFEPRGQGQGVAYRVSECGEEALAASGLPATHDLDGCPQAYLNVDNDLWMVAHADSEGCTCSTFTSNGTLLEEAIIHYAPASDNGDKAIRRLPSTSTFAFAVIEQSPLGFHLMGFNLNGSSQMLASATTPDAWPADTNTEHAFDAPAHDPNAVYIMAFNVGEGKGRVYRVALAIDCNNNGIEDSDELDAGLAEDCNANDIPDECDLADGTSQDCNTNDIPDECDIADGTSDDCDGNGVPDACEALADCDGDGISDACAILGGAADINPVDGVPDSCQGLPRGACCHGGGCLLSTFDDCFAAQGAYAGDGIDCAAAGCPAACAGDVFEDGVVDINDVLIVLGMWGPCP